MRDCPLGLSAIISVWWDEQTELHPHLEYNHTRPHTSHLSHIRYKDVEPIDGRTLMAIQGNDDITIYGYNNYTGYTILQTLKPSDPELFSKLKGYLCDAVNRLTLARRTSSGYLTRQ